jgi:ATP-binding cassette, subfamily B, bacterial MsbA
MSRSDQRDQRRGTGGGGASGASGASGAKTRAFFWRYLRTYGAWAGLALAGVLVFAAANGAIVALVEPIFSEVLLTDEVPAALGGGVLSRPKEQPPAAPTAPTAARAEGAKTAAEASPLGDLKRRLDISRHLDESYRSVKRRLGIGPAEVVYFVPLLFVLVFLLRSLADFVSGYAFQRIGLGVTTDIRNDLYRHVLGQSSRFHAEHPSGELVARVINDVAMMQNAVSNRLLDLFQQSLTLLVLLVLLLSAHFRLAAICLIAAPILVYPIVRFGKGMRRTSHSSQERMADLASLMAEGVRGHRVVKAFGMEEFELGRFRQATARHLRVNLWAQMLAHASGPVVEALAAIGAAALLVFAGQSIRNEQLTAGQLIRFIVTLLMMYDPIRKLNKVNLVLQEAMAAGQRVAGLMAIPNEVVEAPGARRLEKVEQGIAFEKVSFAYEDRPVLSDVELRIRAGEIVALVGPSGAGKTTLVNLLPRFFETESGRVAIDGIDIRQIELKSLRALIGIVTQDTLLFNDTIRANIAYGRSDLPLERVREAAAAAYADEFIMEMPHTYDTVIGESGLRLSGGQRQRLAIARALLKNAPILILDEATSQLDSQSEALVQKALYNLMQGRTTLVIAHRLSTVMQADRIVVMEAGRIVEIGSHRELLELGGTYKRLYDLQFRV